MIYSTDTSDPGAYRAKASTRAARRCTISARSSRSEDAFNSTSEEAGHPYFSRTVTDTPRRTKTRKTDDRESPDRREPTRGAIRTSCVCARAANDGLISENTVNETSMRRRGTRNEETCLDRPTRGQRSGSAQDKGT